MKKIKKVKFLDLSVKNKKEQLGLHNVLDRFLDHGQFVMGHEIETLEKKLSSFVGKRNCVSVSSGTDAIYLALKALNIGEGDEVITTPLSWIATANAIAMTSAEPVFCDIQNDLNIDPNSIEKLINTRTKAIVSVDYTGNLANYDQLEKIAKSKNLLLIQDGSQSFGSSYKGKMCGAFGSIAGISHNPMKVFGALGEMGSIYTDDDEIANKLKILRYNGTINKEFLKYNSLNFRADALQAAFLSLRLETLSEKIIKRRKIAEKYNKGFSNLCEIPKETKDSRRVFYTYTIQCEKRNELMKHLANNNIETKIQHPLLMSQQKPFLSCRSNSYNALRIVNRILCLPIYESMEEDSVDYVIEKVTEFFK